MNQIKQIFKIDKNPKRGLLPIEWLVMGYMLLTLLIVLFAYTRVENPQAMIWGRVRIAATTVALWGAYRLVPCRFTRAVRVVVQMALLAWWYPDTYEINRMFPNLDHVFATWEQQLFGCQPALFFASTFPSPVVSELMSMGYASYYPMIVLITFFYLFCRYREYERAAFVVLATFFIYYVIYIFVPVAGPTFYYKAVGLKQIVQANFPAVNDYFNTHTDCLATPGYTDGFFYHMVENAKAAGERPTAAFPSSHVGVATVIMLLAGHTRNSRLCLLLLPFFVFLCMSTVYIQAHYVIDAIAGLLTGVLFYFGLMAATRNMAPTR